MINLEIEIISPESKEHVYALRNYLAENMENLQISIKEQAPAEGQMSVFSVEGLLNGIIHAGVGIGIEQCIHILWPLISEWLKKMKSSDGKKIEVLATLGDNSNRVTFSEDTDGITKRYDNVTYSIDTAHTRVILIGSGEFENDFVPIPPVKGNVEDLYRLLVDKRNVGIPPENITVALNKTNTEVEELLLRVSKLPETETLLIYFSGHGYRSDVDKLHLIARNTRKVEDHILSGIDYDFIKKVILKTSPAKQKIVILDACHSGIATQGGQDSIMEINVTGTYVLASSESDEVSYFDKNKRNTFFTGALLDIFRNGIDNAREMLALNDLYENSRNFLDQKQQPRYKDKLNISPADFFVARNPSFSIDKNINHAFALYKAGNLADALRECRKILKRSPENAEIKNLAEQCNNDQLFIRFVKEGDEFFYQSHQYKKALESYEQAYEIKPDFAIGEKIRSCKEFLHSGDQSMSSTIVPPAPVKKQEPKKKVRHEHEDSVEEEKKHGIPQKLLALIIAVVVIGAGSLIMMFFHEKKEKYSIAELSVMLSTDPETAFANLRKSKKKDSANYILGNYSRENKEFDTARYYYKQAIAASNLPAAYSTLGEMYVKGELKDSMSSEIGYFLLKRADSLMKADTNAYYWLGNIVSSKARFAQDSSVYVWTGDIVSSEGHFLRTGHPNEMVLFEEAEKWYNKGYKKGSVSCGYQLAFLYLRDKPDVKMAFRYMKEAAEKNRPLAQFYLSHMLDHGNGVAINKNEADRWFQLFLKNADPDDLILMGSKCYYGETNFDRGYDLEKDCIKALALYNAAESKFGQLINEYKKEEAYLNLGLLYENGCDNTVKPDLQKAIGYYKKGAELFDNAAQMQLDRLKVK